MNMKIYLVRHGESVQNTGENEKLGLADHRIVLTEKGKEQARASALVLRDELNKNLGLKSKCRVWYSPYDRTKETKDVFDSVINFEELGIDTREDIRLTEQQFGLFDSLPEEKWKEVYPREYECFRKFKDQKGKFWARYPLGESPFDVACRVKTFFGTIQRDYEKHGIDTLVIFTHGVTLRTFTMEYLHLGVAWYEEEKNPGNCWIRLIDGHSDKGYLYKA